MIRLCIFDLDGTLLDTLGTIRSHLNAALATEGLPPVTVGQTKAFVGNGAKMLVRRALSACGATDEETFARVFPRYSDIYDADPVGETKPYPGIENALKTLHGAGVKLAVVSNKPDSTTKDLVSLFFPGLFAIVEGGKEGHPFKPDPEAIRPILEALDVPPAETAYFGDSGVDMKTGKNFGAALTCGVLWGFREREELLADGADLLLSSAEEIPEVLRRA